MLGIVSNSTPASLIGEIILMVYTCCLTMGCVYVQVYVCENLALKHCMQACNTLNINAIANEENEKRKFSVLPFYSSK